MRELSHQVSIDSAKKYFIYIGMENLLDMVLTLIAIINGYGREINPLLSHIVDNTFLFILFKGIIPTILLIIVFLRLQRDKTEDINKSIKCLKICFWWYIGILCSHITWIYVVFL